MNPPITAQHNGRSYTYDGERWFGLDDYTTPPQSITIHLDAVLVQMLCEEDDRITDRKELMRRARDARKQTQYKRAERIAQRLLAQEPNSTAVAAILCSILRESGRASEAVVLADQFASEECVPIMTSRAAALCDLERWGEALQEIRQVLQLRKSAEATAVENRIKRYAPKTILKDRRNRGKEGASTP
jgi:hypothetical protein